ncbi:hypothetical protein ACKVEX_13720 [Rhodocyclaceae bacterium SMB388]
MFSVSLGTASALTGVSVRTLWRRIANGDLRTCKDGGASGRTLVAVEDLLAHSRIDLSGDELALVCAADAGDPEAQCDLGLAFLRAGLVDEAARWFAAAAERFYPEAMHQLGRCYLTGCGVERDEAVGRQWMGRAAERGHAVAAELSRYLDQPGRPTLAAAALESELDALERRLILNVLEATAE